MQWSPLGNGKVTVIYGSTLQKIIRQLKILRSCPMTVIYRVTAIQLFRERLSEKVHVIVPKGIVGRFECTVLQRNLKEWRGPVHGHMFVSAKGKQYNSSRLLQSSGSDRSPYYLSGLSRAHFSDNLSRNGCIQGHYMQVWLYATVNHFN